MSITFGSTAYLLVILDETGARKDVGIYRPPHRWEVTGDVTFRAPGSGFRRDADDESN